MEGGFLEKSPKAPGNLSPDRKERQVSMETRRTGESCSVGPVEAGSPHAAHKHVRTAGGAASNFRRPPNSSRPQKTPQMTAWMPKQHPRFLPHKRRLFRRPDYNRRLAVCRKSNKTHLTEEEEEQGEEQEQEQGKTKNGRVMPHLSVGSSNNGGSPGAGGGDASTPKPVASNATRPAPVHPTLSTTHVTISAFPRCKSFKPLSSSTPPPSPLLPFLPPPSLAAALSPPSKTNFPPPPVPSPPPPPVRGPLCLRLPLPLPPSSPPPTKSGNGGDIDRKLPTLSTSSPTAAALLRSFRRIPPPLHESRCPEDAGSDEDAGLVLALPPPAPAAGSRKTAPPPTPPPSLAAALLVESSRGKEPRRMNLLLPPGGAGVVRRAAAVAAARVARDGSRVDGDVQCAFATKMPTPVDRERGGGRHGERRISAVRGAKERRGRHHISRWGLRGGVEQGWGWQKREEVQDVDGWLLPQLLLPLLQLLLLLQQLVQLLHNEALPPRCCVDELFVNTAAVVDFVVACTAQRVQKLSCGHQAKKANKTRKTERNCLATRADKKVRKKKKIVRVYTCSTTLQWAADSAQRAPQHTARTMHKMRPNFNGTPRQPTPVHAEVPSTIYGAISSLPLSAPKCRRTSTYGMISSPIHLKPSAVYHLRLLLCRRRNAPPKTVASNFPCTMHRPASHQASGGTVTEGACPCPAPAPTAPPFLPDATFEKAKNKNKTRERREREGERGRARESSKASRSPVARRVSSYRSARVFRTCCQQGAPGVLLGVFSSHNRLLTCSFVPLGLGVGTTALGHADTRRAQPTDNSRGETQSITALRAQKKKT